MAAAHHSVPARLREAAPVTVAPPNAVFVSPGESSAAWLVNAGGRLTDGPIQTGFGGATETMPSAGASYQRRERPVVEAGQS